MNILKTLAALAALSIVPAWGQSAKFPDQPLRIIVPFAAGGGVDSAARLLAEQLRAQFGTATVVENRAGANGTLGGKVVQTAAADGYTLLFSAATHVLAKQVMLNAPYEPQDDFTAVARVGEAPLMLVIAPTLEQHKLSEVITAAAKEPGKWTAAIPAAGAPSHLATLLLAKQSKVEFTFVPYKGTQPALTDLGGGHVQLLMDSMISMLPLAKAGRVKPIIITSAKRSPLMPDVPTAQEAGYPGVTYSSWYGVWAPKDTPADKVQTLNTMINAAVGELAKSGKFSQLGIEPVTETSAQFKSYVATYVNQSAELLKGAGFKAE